MTEQELREKIRESAEEILIPEAVTPEACRKRLEGQKMAKVKKRNVAVASVMILFCISAAAFVSVVKFSGINGQLEAREDGSKDAKEAAVAKESSDAKENSVTEGSDSGETDIRPCAAEKTPAGDLYLVAADYGEVYDLVSASGTAYTDLAQKQQSSQLSDGSTWQLNGAAEDAASEMDRGGAEIQGHSSVNLQTDGVDESDIARTDGSFIYHVDGNSVWITDISEENMKKTGQIVIPDSHAADRIVEIYVDGDSLSMIVERSSAEIGGNIPERYEFSVPEKDTGVIPLEGDTEQKTEEMSRAVEDVYYFNSYAYTELLTYDISDRSKPVLAGTVTQDGGYKTSRKIGDVIYLFTEQLMETARITREEALTDGKAEGFIPLINGKPVAADCIYLPEWGNQGLLISSVDVKNPDQVVDNAMIVNQYVDIYVSMDAVYLYGNDLTGAANRTKVAKFKIENGGISGTGAAVVNGTINDTFAIHEYQGDLRILTTDWSGPEPENGLYLFDESLVLTGKLEGIAKGETVYAARFLGDMAYFITYRNKDPLFAVDLSDAENPKIVSELEITGFSEYLHFWGEDKLLGIGYETDEKTGVWEGIKLVLFDISKLSELKVEKTHVIKDVYTSPAIYDYKSVLADPEKNLIGFALGGGDEGDSYRLFSWENGAFEEKLNQPLDKFVNLEDYRGIYCGNLFYLVSPEEIVSFDLKDGCKLLETMKYE